MKIFLSLGLALSLLSPAILLAEDWTSNNFPVSNFSFEQYNEVTHHFTDWELGNTDTMEPEVFDQSLMPSLHYTACAHIVENEIGQYQESCYLKNTFISAPQTSHFNGKPCYLVAFVKCSGVTSATGTGGVFAEVYIPGVSFNPTYTSQMLTNEHNWCKLIVPFTFPTAINQQIQVRVGLRNATGEVWIDYVQIVQMETMKDGSVYADLENPSFDYTPGTLWGWTPSPPSKTGITADASNHMNGPISAKFSVTGYLPPEDTAYLYQSITTSNSAKTYYASAFVKTAGLLSMSVQHPGAKLHIHYASFDWYSQSIVGDQKWTRIQGTFDKPAITAPGTPDLTLKLETSAYAGNAWFDWVTLKLNPVQNPGFNNWSTPSIPPPPPNLMVWYKEGEGTGGYSTYYSHSAPSSGIISNNNKNYDTTLMQELLGDGSPSLREGATYLLTGWIKTDTVAPQPGQPGDENIIPKGAFVDVVVWKDGQFITLASSEPLVGSTTEWQEFSLCFSLPLDYFITETDDLYSMKNDGITTFDPYEIRCRLSLASGTAYFDDVNLVELEPTEDLATVVPQPQAVQNFGYFSDPLVSFNPSKVVTIYYTPDGSPDPELGDTYQFSANNLQQELNRAFYECTGVNLQSGYTGWEDIKYNYPIPASNIKKLDSTVTSLAKPCIILGDPSLDGSTGHLFQNELLKRGMVLPQDISPEGYIMQIDQETILIAASDSVIITQGENDSTLVKGAGSFYGTETLLQMLDIEQRSITPINCPGGVTYLPNKVVAPAGYIYDYPDMVWRGQMSYIGSGVNDSPDSEYSYPIWNIYDNTGFEQSYDNDIVNNKKLFAQQMAKFKMNRLQLFSPIYFFLKCDVPQGPKPGWKHYQYLVSLFDYCRKLHIEPIPMLGDWPSALLRHNGNCLEYMIFDSQYIDDMGLVPGNNDYYSVEPGDRYPYPMPQPSWEFIVDSAKNNYFADNTVEIWDEDQQDYMPMETGCYRVCGNDIYEIRVEVWNEEQNIWDPPLTEGYTLHNVGLNDGNTSYYRFHTEDEERSTGFYGYQNPNERAYITFDPSLNGKKVRVSYAAPINMGLIWPLWGSLPTPRQFSCWTCLSDFDQDLPTDPETQDIWQNWTGWDSRDIWYIALYEMINWLKPRYIDIQHCEQWVMHLDKRCQYLRGLTPNYPSEEIYPVGMRTWEHNAWNYGHEIEFLRKTIADLDDILTGNAQLMLYADMLDSHNGRYAEGRCRWDWYDTKPPDEYHQPDSDDDWVGNVASHIYYQPAMGGMGGWTWDTREDPDGLECPYGMMASDYITQRDSIVCSEWGYQAGYFDDRDPENVILWQDKFAERYDKLKDQGFTNFVGGCAGYALALEGRDWGGIRFRCRDELAHMEGTAGIGGNNSSFIQLDGTNLKWVQMNFYMSGLQHPGLGIHMYLEVYNLDPKYAGTEHINPDYGTGCHLGMVQDGWGYADDVQVMMNDTYDLTPDIYNSLFEYEFPNEGDQYGEQNWTPTQNLYDSWLLDDFHPNTGNHCCKFLMDDNLYEYSQLLFNPTLNERRYVDSSKYPNTLNFSVYLRTIKLDALRHLNVKSWMDLTYNYQYQDKILGMINTQWGEVRNYSSEPTSADWMWSRKYPVSPLIKYMYYDAFYMFMGDRATHPDDTYPPNAPYSQDAESWTEP